VIDGQVAFLIDGSQFELVGSDLVVTGLDRNPNSKARISKSFMKAATRSGMAPK